jgi:hypothetical protein
LATTRSLARSMRSSSLLQPRLLAQLADAGPGELGNGSAMPGSMVIGAAASTVAV